MPRIYYIIVSVLSVVLRDVAHLGTCSNRCKEHCYSARTKSRLRSGIFAIRESAHCPSIIQLVTIKGRPSLMAPSRTPGRNKREPDYSRIGVEGRSDNPATSE